MTVDRRIVVATDLSARCDRPLERAMLLGKQLGAALLILHVLEPQRRLATDDEQRLRTLLQDEFGLAGENAEICFDYGSVPFIVAKVAKERGCSLIVTGVARYNNPGDFVLGTAVDYLVRQSSVPVLVVKRRARRPYDRLVVGTDFSPASVRAISAAASLFPDARVRLVHAYEAAFRAFLDHDSTAPLIREEAEREMKRVAAELPEALLSKVEMVVEEGCTATVLAANVNELGDDLLVLGTWHRRRHAHFMGSEDAWALPAKEPCDVLIVGKAVHDDRLPGRTRPAQTETG